jgi:hypothetical protein
MNQNIFICSIGRMENDAAGKTKKDNPLYDA